VTSCHRGGDKRLLNCEPSTHLARLVQTIRSGGVTVKLIGIVLIVAGVLALAFGGFSYTKREKVIDLGPLQATTERQKTVPIAPIAGVAALVGGIVLVLAGSRTGGK
jgi:uncharacterized membrane protein YidH (DUF202 family)